MSLPSVYSYLSLEKAQALVSKPSFEKTATWGDAAKIVGKSTLGFGAGTGAGYVTGALVEKIHHAVTGQEIPPSFLLPAASLLGAGMGLAYSMYKSQELEDLQHAVKAKRDKP